MNTFWISSARNRLPFSSFQSTRWCGLPSRRCTSLPIVSASIGSEKRSSTPDTRRRTFASRCASEMLT